jgi:hypothetical protein
MSHQTKTSKNIVFIIENNYPDNEWDDNGDCNKEIVNDETYYSRNKALFKERYLNNLESKRAYQNDYNLINCEKYKKYQSDYYQIRKTQILETKKEKVLCECGKMVSAGHLTCHKKSNIHLKRMNNVEYKKK